MIRKGHNKKILIVEDEVRIALSLRRALEHPLGGGHIVEISPSPSAALVRIQNETFDLLITDLKMPGMNGLELIRTIRQMKPEMHAILITAFNSASVENQAHNLAATYIKKPFNLPKFVTIVQEMLDGETQMIILSEDDIEPINDDHISQQER